MLLPLDTPAAVLERADRAMYGRKTGRRGTLAEPAGAAADLRARPRSTG
jgi:hypothetical protein